jgi:hypothetical protein
LYTLGPPFPSAGKNRTEIARKEHNERLAADNARNSVSSAKCGPRQTLELAPLCISLESAESSRADYVSRDQEKHITPTRSLYSTLKGCP